MVNKVHLIGYASGLAAGNAGCGDGPAVLKQSPYLLSLQQQYPQLQWDSIITEEGTTVPPSDIATVAKLNQQLAMYTEQAVRNQEFFITIGGDHACGMGSWSGAYAGLAGRGDLGLIWFDAHMDAHTFDTTETGNVHGMPVAALLGHGDPQFTNIAVAKRKLLPQNLVLMGIRSYESGEQALLEKVAARIYYMEEIHQRGFTTVFTEAVDIIKQHTIAYGISIDLDGFDPGEVPGIGTPVDGGINTRALLDNIHHLHHDQRFIGADIVEFNPHLDREHKTEKIVVDILRALIKD